MITRQRRGFILALLLSVGWSAAQAADETAVVRKATRLLEEISANPESGIPLQYLREARGIMIMPALVETQLGVGRKKGHGVFLSRNEKGEWGEPEPVEISGLSVGAVAGRTVTDLVLIYRTQKAADKHGVHTWTLGLSAQVSRSLKPRRKLSGPGPDSKTKKDVLTYYRYRGLLVGAAIEGDHKWAPSPTPVALKAPTTADRNVADGKAQVKAALDAPGPEVARLRTVLTAMTTPPPAHIAESGKKDLKVSSASGTKPSAETAASRR